MRTALFLLEIFVAAVVVALGITLTNVSPGAQLLATISVTPLIALSLVFVIYCRKGKVWSYAGAAILGAIGVALRVVISAYPSLEVGGGLPVGVTVLYIVLGVLVSLKSFESVLELRNH